MAAPSTAKSKSAPIVVIRRSKRAHHGHHGGAWKIAYADFVTAMMAFFLLMWLLGSTSKGELNGIAEYFNNPLRVAMGGGSGSGDSSSVLKGGGTDLTRAMGQVKKGDIEAQKRTINLQALRADRLKVEADRMNKVMSDLELARDTDPRLKAFRDQVRLDMTKDGLRIQIVDDKNGPMFDSGSTVVKGFVRDFLHTIGQMLNNIENKVTLSGHTDAHPYPNGRTGYSNWELSADRANASRRELIAGGMDESKIYRVLGLAASVPFNAEDPLHPSNRRITLIVMNKEAEARLTRGGGQIEVEDADDVAAALNSPAEPVSGPPAAPDAADPRAKP